MCPIIDCSLVSDDYTGVDNHCGNRNKMNCDLQFDDTFSSLFGSIINFGCLFGALAGGTVVDKVGKKVGTSYVLRMHCSFVPAGGHAPSPCALHCGLDPHLLRP